MVLALAEAVTMEQKLRRWNYLERRRQHLERRKAMYEERIERLKGELTSDGILSAITQKYEHMLLGLPSAKENIYDRQAEHLVASLDALEEYLAKYDSIERELRSVTREIEEIEDAVACLEPRYQQLLTMFHRDKIPWRDICETMYISKTRLYEMLETAYQMMAT